MTSNGQGRLWPRRAALLGAAAVAGGLWLGAATAAPLQERPPLHRAVASRLRGETARPTPREFSILRGIYLRPAPDGGAVIATAGGRTVEVRPGPDARLPARRPRPGDRLLAIGRVVVAERGAEPGAEPGDRSDARGEFEARAVFLRRGFPLLRDRLGGGP